MGYESSAGGRRRQLRDGKAVENEKEGTPEGTGVLPH